MLRPISHATLSACILFVSAPAQGPQTAGATQADRQASLIQLRYASFDPLAQMPEVPATLRSTARQNLRIVQFAASPTQAGRDAIAEFGGQVIGYLPHDAYVVRIAAEGAEAVRNVAAVRWVGSYHPAYRLEPELLAAQAHTQPAPVRYNIVVADKHRDKPGLMAKVQAIGGRVDNEQVGSLLLEVTLTGPQLLQVAGFDEVLWIDRWTPAELDMDNARIQGGGNYLETQSGYTGTGVNAHIYEGIEATHPDFTGGAVNVRSGGGADTHGHATGGIVFGNGTSNPAVRGMAPDAGKFFTQYGTVSGSRWQVFDDLVNLHDVSHTTASWGGARTFFYTSVSAESDDIVFDHDLVWTQSQSNAGNQDSRPQAWAKNVFSIGGVNHANDSNPNNDSWQNGSASIGPASDGRNKPELCAYYDNIGTSDRTGSAGYSSGSWTGGFGGTSGATPIVAGHNVLAIQMYTDEVTTGYGPFGNQLRVPGGSSHQNRPHFPTLKALQVVSANQYAFTGASTDNRREHQGWGFPNLQNLWDNRGKTFIVDEQDVLTQGQVRSWGIAVAAGEPALKVCLNWNEPAANPASQFHLINNLSLRITSPSGVQYWGNHDLGNGVWSTAGGSEDTINSMECVFVQNPQAGNWNIEVLATSVVQDNHVETPAVDADYGLVVVGGTGTQVQFATFSTFGDGCPGSVSVPGSCPELNPNGGTLSNNTNTYEYTFAVPASGTTQVTSFDIYTRSNSGTLVRPAHIYLPAGSGPSTTPLASTTITVGTTPGFYTATFASPVTVNGPFFIGYENSPSGVISNLSTGANGTGFYRTAVTGNWAQSALVQSPSWRVSCISAPTFLVPAIGNNGLAQLGTTYDLTLTDALGTTFAVLVSGLSDSTWSGGSLPAALPGAPGCDLLVAADVLEAAITTAAGTANSSITVPNSAGLLGLQAFHQWAVLDGVNALGIVMSNGARVAVGQ